MRESERKRGPVVFLAAGVSVTKNCYLLDGNPARMAFTGTKPCWEDNLPLQVKEVLLMLAVIAMMLFAIVYIIADMRKKQKADLLGREEQDKQTLKVMAALSADYDGIYYVNLDKDLYAIVKFGGSLREEVANLASKTHIFSKAMRDYIENFVAPEFQEGMAMKLRNRALIERFKTEQNFGVQYQVKPNEGGQTYFEMNFADVSEKSSDHLMVVGFRCVDEAVKLENEKNKALQEAFDSANKANNAKSEFLSKMSHDMRTPMNAIIGMTAIAAANIDDKEKVAESLEKITTASNHLLGIINEVLDMSKIESGKINLKEEEFNLSDLLNSMFAMVQPQIEQHGHHFQMRIMDIRHEDVIGDRLRIQQVFVNIMNNAIKYTPDNGNICLTVTEKKVSQNSYVCYEFVFEDDGIGMSEKYIEHIFDPFSRAEDVRISKIQGTGLGMAISRNIVHMMNGEIHVESEEGIGSKFIITIFLKLQDKQEELPQEQKEFGECKYSDRRALLVDDNELNREIAVEILKMAGMDVEEAENGKEAADKFSQSKDGYYDIIFMDIQMPVMNGYDATAAIRSMKRADALDVPIIAMTANAFMEDVEASKSAGMNEHLSKPIDIEKLSAVLGKYLGSR